jgi:hypothetical protein
VCAKEREEEEALSRKMDDAMEEWMWGNGRL